MFFGEDLAIRYKRSSILGDDDSDDDREPFKTFHSIYDYQEQYKKIGMYILDFDYHLGNLAAINCWATISG